MTALIKSAHPIEEWVRRSILGALTDIERTHNVTILYACESGSRAWGFASPDSDYDVRFIYVHPLPWYLSVETQRDVIERPIDDVLDVSGWELRKTLQLLLRSNPVLPEWLDSPVVYREESKPVQCLRELTENYFSSLKGYHHYYSMAIKNYRGYFKSDQVRLKKYLYVLRPLLAARWIESHHTAPPMRFAALAEGTLTDEMIIGTINRLLDIKMRSKETELSVRWPVLDAFIESELEWLSQRVPQEEERMQTDLLDHFLMTTILNYSG